MHGTAGRLMSRGQSRRGLTLLRLVSPTPWHWVGSRFEARQLWLRAMGSSGVSHRLAAIRKTVRYMMRRGSLFGIIDQNGLVKFICKCSRRNTGRPKQAGRLP